VELVCFVRSVSQNVLSIDVWFPSWMSGVRNILLKGWAGKNTLTFLGRYV
jgi:hypothetical protein